MFDQLELFRDNFIKNYLLITISENDKQKIINSGFSVIMLND